MSSTSPSHCDSGTASTLASFAFGDTDQRRQLQRFLEHLGHNNNGETWEPIRKRRRPRSRLASTATSTSSLTSSSSMPGRPDVSYQQNYNYNNHSHTQNQTSQTRRPHQVQSLDRIGCASTATATRSRRVSVQESHTRGSTPAACLADVASNCVCELVPTTSCKKRRTHKLRTKEASLVDVNDSFVDADHAEEGMVGNMLDETGTGKECIGSTSSGSMSVILSDEWLQGTNGMHTLASELQLMLDQHEGLTSFATSSAMATANESPYPEAGELSTADEATEKQEQGNASRGGYWDGGDDSLGIEGDEVDNDVAGVFLDQFLSCD